MLWSCRLLDIYGKGLLCVLITSDNESFSSCVCKYNIGDRAVEVAHHAADTNTGPAHFRALLSVMLSFQGHLIRYLKLFNTLNQRPARNL